MGHEHDHSAMEGYYLDQLCTIAGCGLLGGIAFVIWKIDLLTTEFKILSQQFSLPLLIGGGALIVIAVLRAVSLWSTVGAKKASAHAHSHDHAHGDHEHHHHDHDHAHQHDHDHECGHSHAPGETCDHDHDHDHSHVHEHDHEHDHDHTHVHSHDGHDHSFAPWRYAVLLLPLMLSGLLIYYHFQGLRLMYSDEWLKKQLGKEVQLADGTFVAARPGIWHFGFTELNQAAMSRDPGVRESFSGQVGELRGLFHPLSENQFTLYRMKMTCCASDAVPLKIRIIAPASLLNRGLQPNKGVAVKGKVEFRKVVDKEQWVPVMMLSDVKDVWAEDIGNDIYIDK